MNEKSLESGIPKNKELNQNSKEELENYDNNINHNANHINVNPQTSSTIAEESLNEKIKTDEVNQQERPSQLLPNIHNIINILILAFAITDLTLNIKNKQNHSYYVLRVISDSFLFCGFVFAIFTISGIRCFLDCAICAYCFCCFDTKKDKKNQSEPEEKEQKRDDIQDNKENQENKTDEKKKVNNSSVFGLTIFIIIDTSIYFISFVVQLASIGIYSKNKKVINHKGIRTFLWINFAITVIKLFLETASIFINMRRKEKTTQQN